MEEQLPDAEPVPPEESFLAAGVGAGAAAESGEEDPRLLPRGRVVEAGQQLPELAVRRVARRHAPLKERRLQVRRRRGVLLHRRGDATHSDRSWTDRRKGGEEIS